MKPQVERILKKFSTEKIELNVTKYITQYIQAGQRVIDNLQDVQEELNIAKEEVEVRKNSLFQATDELRVLEEDQLKYKRDGNTLLSELGMDLKKLEKAAKELEMSPNELSPKYATAKDIFNELGKAITKI